MGSRPAEVVASEPLVEPHPVSENESQIAVISPVSEPKDQPEPESPANLPVQAFDFEAMLAELEAMDLRIVPERFLTKLDVPVLAGNDPPLLTDEVIELFAFGSTEVDRINRAIVHAADSLTAAEIAAVEVTEISDTEVKIELPSLGELADEVQEELRQNVLETLGRTDGLLFLDLMDHSSGDFFNDFGRDVRQYTFSATPTDDNQVKLTIRTARIEAETGLVREEMTQSTHRNSDWQNTHAGRRSFGAEGRRQDHVRAFLPDSLRLYFHSPEAAPQD